MGRDAGPTGEELGEEEFARFRALIYRLSGIRIAPNKRIEDLIPGGRRWHSTHRESRRLKRLGHQLDVSLNEG